MCGVTIKHKKVIVMFTILPNLTNNHTLLGVDFLEKAQIVLNIPKRCWYFCDEPEQQYEFYNEFDVPTNVQVFEVSEQNHLRSDEGEALDPDQRRSFNDLLKENQDIFEPGGGPTDFAIHRIQTIDHPPIAVPPYPLSGPKKEFLRRELDRLLEEEIIEECESPWASPTVLVPKRNGDFRLCIDYRQLNSITISDSYPMPRLEDILHTAKRTPYMTTIDLQSGYWQVSIAEEDRDKTCFVTPFGTFRFNRMPFGLKNAPATFTRLVDRFRAGLGERALFAYMDDFLVLSETFERHIEDLREVFKRLRLFKLRARREKCFFVRNSVKYLGHVITPAGIEPDPEKISAIKEMKPPCCLKDVQSFVQTCSWYRKFVPKFSDIARPLTNLLRKNNPFKFGPEEKEAFEALKQRLISAPILTQADQSLPYVLRTDASNYALGAVLLQGEGHDERPVAYASRLLTDSEKNYSTVEREALSVIWSAEKFRIYLEGAEVTIATDHQPLKWLFSIKTPSGRLARWALRIQGLNMKITYTPAKMNVVADTLSRPFCIQDAAGEHCQVNFVSVEMPNMTKEVMREKQTEDRDLQKIIVALEGEDPVEFTRWSERGYIMSDGVLYRFEPDSDGDEPQLVIPASCREEIMKQYHDSSTAGHYGVDRTLQKIASKFYFIGMRRYITEYIRNCIECQRYKASNVKPAGLLQTPAPSQRFEVIAVDLFGPLPETPQKKRWILIVEDIAPKRDGPYMVKEVVAPNSYVLCEILKPSEIIGKFHISDITPFKSNKDSPDPVPVVPKRRRGRPKKKKDPSNPEPLRRPSRGPEGESVTPIPDERLFVGGREGEPGGVRPAAAPVES